MINTMRRNSVGVKVHGREFKKPEISVIRRLAKARIDGQQKGD